MMGVKKKKTTYSRPRKIKRKPKKKRWQSRMIRACLEWGVSLGLLSLLLYSTSMFAFTFARVQGYSMLPTLNNNEWVFINKLAKPKRFKLVLFKDPRSRATSVRRVIGLPGESICYKKDTLYVNDHEIYERFLALEILRARGSQSLYTGDWALKQDVIPKGKYIVLGDNRPFASDSRDYGFIDEKEIVGVVEMRVMPLHLIQQF